jgi:TIR domain
MPSARMPARSTITNSLPEVLDNQASEPRHDVFISYARSDAAIAPNLAHTLWNEGFEVWFDERHGSASK